MKNKEDLFYLKFLNRYGDLIYTKFKIEDEKYINKKGLYAFFIVNDLKYIGRCLDNFYKRINLGYGRIFPKNCYLGGQATNCHINSLIAKNKEDVKFFVFPLNDNQLIKEIEKELISSYKPEWNINAL